jgi:hypothetical protein
MQCNSTRDADLRSVHTLEVYVWQVGGASGDGAILISTGIGLVAILGAFIFGLQISAF